MRKNKKPIIVLLVAGLLVVGGYALFSGDSAPKSHGHEEGHDDHEAHDDEPLHEEERHQESHDDHEAHGDEPSHEEEGHDEHGDEHGGHAEGGHSDSTKITTESAKTMGIETVTAAPATIRQTVALSGRIVLNQNKAAQVKARFSGIVRDVFKQVGDAVKRGERLASVESNESLQVYHVPSPLDGVVLERTISIGDTAEEAPIFVVADLSSLWAEFYIFAGDMDSIQQGQTVLVHTLDGKNTATGTLITIQPTAEASSQSIVARTAIDNADGKWRSGMTVRGDVVVQEQPVGLAVPTDAIQRMEGNSVVFVREGKSYHAVPVTLGIADNEMTEITSGLNAGAEVVSKNSFIVKADIGKASAEHEH